MSAHESPNISSRFRKLPIREKRAHLQDELSLTEEEMAASGCAESFLELADVMVESAVGFMPVPLGITPPILIDGKHYYIPMATEEPSVIAAAGFAGSRISFAGGFTTTAEPPVMTAQIYLEGCSSGAEEAVRDGWGEVEQAVAPLLESMTRRGGGLVDFEIVSLEDPPLLRVHLHIDVRDAMGANILNSTAERASGPLERLSGGRKVMAILTNEAARRTVSAEFRIPLAGLARGNVSGTELGRRIELGSRIAEEDPSRAVTHNKGIMNGITALALATGNDTRGLEAAAHAYAARSGRYRSLSQFRVEGEELRGRLRLPVALGTVGGAVGIHPVSSFSLKALGDPGAGELCRVAAALGLAQNYAAVSALVSEGIQAGHMRLHSERLAYQAGARDEEIRRLAKKLFEAGTFNLANARLLLAEIRDAMDRDRE